MRIFVIVFYALLITACSSDEDSSENSSGNTSGIITLSGNDSAIVGTILDTGFIGSSLAAGAQPDYIVIVDKDSKVTFTKPNILTPDTADDDNAFVLVVTDDSAGSGNKGISMSITTDGTQRNYACTTPVTVFIECGLNSINLDIENKTITFTNLTVTNTSTSTVLTMAGTLTW